MKVKELVDALLKLPQDDLVVVRGYEDGYDDVMKVEKIHVALTSEPEYYYGVYSMTSASDPNAISAVFIKQFDRQDKHELKRRSG